MYEVTQLRNGTYFKEDGVPYEVLNYEHIKMGRGTANVKLKVKNILNGAIVMKGYISNARVEEVELEEQRGIFTYRTKTDYVFEVEGEDEPVEIALEIVGEKGPYLKKGMEVRIKRYEGEPLSIDIPIKATYKVKEAPPDARGNTVTNSYKEVLLDNNLTIKAPMFIKTGDEIIVDTRTGAYMSRA